MNVLNVIEDDQDLSDVICSCLRAGNRCVFQVYEGDRTGVGRETKKDCFQRNQRTAWYLDLIQSRVSSGYVTRKGNVIEVIQ